MNTIIRFFNKYHWLFKSMGSTPEDSTSYRSKMFKKKKKKRITGDFPGGPVVKTLPSNTGSPGSIPGQGVKLPHGSQPKKIKHKAEAIL